MDTTSVMISASLCLMIAWSPTNQELACNAHRTTTCNLMHVFQSILLSTIAGLTDRSAALQFAKFAKSGIYYHLVNACWFLLSAILFSPTENASFVLPDTDSSTIPANPKKEQPTPSVQIWPTLAVSDAQVVLCWASMDFATKLQLLNVCLAIVKEAVWVVNKATLQVECVFPSIWWMSIARVTINRNVPLVFRDII